jgi:hypothetical protein
MKTTLSFLLICAAFLLPVKAQDTLRVLFLGNSYTSFNNLPTLVQSMATSAGKTMIVDNNMPGGFTISQHLNDPTSLAKINAGNWDYVVIQEQSQLPTIDFYRYNDMYPALSDIKTLIEFSNPCAKIITYMTWGRRFGGQQCDPGGTYCSPNFTNFKLCTAFLYMEFRRRKHLFRCLPYTYLHLTGKLFGVSHRRKLRHS